LIFGVQATTAVGTDSSMPRRPRPSAPSCTIGGGRSIGG
jgi:hypothetical protein